MRQLLHQTQNDWRNDPDAQSIKPKGDPHESDRCTRWLGHGHRKNGRAVRKFQLIPATNWRNCRLTQVNTPSLLFRFLILYGGLFAAFGVASPFLPGLLKQDGLSASAIGIVLGAGTAIRLLAGPVGGRLADSVRRPSLVLTSFTAASAIVAIGYAPARGLPLLLLVSVAHATMLAPLTPLADALALGSAGSKPGFAYGWVRGAGSAAFIAGTLMSGWLVERKGLSVIIWLNCVFLALSALIAIGVPDRLAGKASAPAATSAFGPWHSLWGMSIFVRLMVIVALIGGSHALHDGFEVIRWRSAGLSASQSSVLWSMSVAAEVIVFLLIGQPLLRRLGPSGALTLSAFAGVVRWSTAANTAAFPVMALVEPLHGLTFALLHLTCMDVIGRNVPKSLAATAQAFYATIAMGLTAALVTMASGPLYERFGAASFWGMAAMCALALPLAMTLRPGTSSSTQQ